VYRTFLCWNPPRAEVLAGLRTVETACRSLRAFVPLIALQRRPVPPPLLSTAAAAYRRLYSRRPSLGILLGAPASSQVHRLFDEHRIAAECGATTADAIMPGG